VVAWLLCLSFLVATSPAVANTIQVIDDWQRKVTLTAPASRVVALSAHLTQLSLEAGLGKNLVATDLHSDLTSLSATDAKRVVRLAAFPQPSIESIAQLQPDLVLLWGAGLKPATVAALERLGFAVFVSDPQRLGDIISNLSRLGELAGKGVTSDPDGPLAQRIKRLNEKLAPWPFARRVPVFVQVWQRPLLTLGRRSLIGHTLEHCGAQILLAPESHTTAQINPEAVLSAPIKAIVATDASAAQKYWDLRDPQRRNRKWGYLSLENSVLSQPSAALIDSLQVLCERLDSLR
jgi:iron complex transport system substrate-binding protein